MGGYGSGGWNATGRPTYPVTSCALMWNVLNKAGALELASRVPVDGTSEVKSNGLRHDALRPPRALDRLGHRGSPGHMGRLPLRRPAPLLLLPGLRRAHASSIPTRAFPLPSMPHLSYPSQRERESDRAQERLTAFADVWAASPGWHQFVPRPKGMHRRTYQRLVTEIVKADAVTDQRARYLCG